jgi:hypothetical protein
VRYSLAIVKSGFGPAEARSALGELLAARRDAAVLYLFTDHKFEGDRSVIVKNLEGDYGTAAVYLRNAAIAAAASGVVPYGREGLDLLCLERAIGISRADCFFLMRQGGTLSDADISWLEHNETDFFREVSTPDGNANYLFDCRLELTKKAISLALDLYRSGSLLSLSNPSLRQALSLTTSVLSKATGRDRSPSEQR